MKKDISYISLGAGVQSSALYILSCLGRRDVPRVDVAIFADTQVEPAWVYEQVDRLEKWSQGRIPIHRVTAGNLAQPIIDRHREGGEGRFAAIPAFTTGDDGRYVPLRRQCTREYKITPIEREVRRLMGYAKGERIKHHAKAHIGMSVDEVTRIGISKTPWVSNHYPLVDARIGREGCIAIVEAQDLPRPRKSACVFCPYHNNKFWLDLQENYPAEFQRAVRFDRQIRDMTKSGVERPAFLHRELIPLDQVQFNKNPDQIELFDEECAGVCGV